MSLLNVDAKIIIKEQLINVLSKLISAQQTAYIKNRFIAECGKLISGIVDILIVTIQKGIQLQWTLEKRLILLIQSSSLRIKKNLVLVKTLSPGLR